MPPQVVSGIGLLALVGLCYAVSTARAHIRWRTVIAGILLQFLLSAIILRTRPGFWLFSTAGEVLREVVLSSRAGAEFIFGSLADPQVFGTAMGDAESRGFLFFVHVGSTIIFLSSLLSLAYYCGLMQKVIAWVARAMQHTMKTSGAETVVTAANIFIGQTEAPLTIGPLLRSLTRSELLVVMVSGMATISVTVIGAYISMLKDHIPNAAGHLLAASVLSAPAALVVSKVLLPELEQSVSAGTVKIKIERVGATFMEAVCHGATTGLKLALNVMAVVLACVAMVQLLSLGWDIAARALGWEGLTLRQALGIPFRGVAFLLGIPWGETKGAGSILAQQLLLNEFIAYEDLARRMGAAELSSRSGIILTYAICGFANLSSIGIQIGGIGTLVPERRAELATLGFRALLGGATASYMTACITGLLLPA